MNPLKLTSMPCQKSHNWVTVAVIRLNDVLFAFLVIECGSSGCDDHCICSLLKATMWVIIIHAREGLTDFIWCRRARCLHLPFEVQAVGSPLYPPECQPIGTAQGLDIMSAGYHYMCVFSPPPDRLALVRSGASRGNCHC